VEGASDGRQGNESGAENERRSVEVLRLHAGKVKGTACSGEHPKLPRSSAGRPNDLSAFDDVESHDLASMTPSTERSAADQ
jgi:hypothetical protein